MTETNSNLAEMKCCSRFRAIAWLQRHEQQLWWLHSLYALFLGIGIMWLGNRNYAFLRITVFHISFIWLSSLLLRSVIESPRLTPRWQTWLRAVINYFNKNFYQQVLFFILPIYYASATFPSRNFAFVVLIAVSAALSSLDIVYDQHLSTRRGLNALFFAFNVFVLINVMLPVLWSIANAWAARIAALSAAFGFLTLYLPFSHVRVWKKLWIAAPALILLVIVELGRVYVPPAPLRLMWSEFGPEFDRQSMRVANAINQLDPADHARLFGLTAIRAPLGLKERVRHRWYLDGRLIFTSAAFEITGGRDDGFRLWTICNLENVQPGSTLYIDAETESGQLIGRARIEAR